MNTGYALLNDPEETYSHEGTVANLESSCGILKPEVD